MNLGPFGKSKYFQFLISNWPKVIHCPTFVTSFIVPIFEGASILPLLEFHHCSSTLEKVAPRQSSSSSSIVSFIDFIYYAISNFYFRFIHFSTSFVNLVNFLEFLHCPIFLVHFSPNSQRNGTNFYLHQIHLFVNFASSTIVSFLQVSLLAIFLKKLG
jgi:hypothetical protein